MHLSAIATVRVTAPVPDQQYVVAAINELSEGRISHYTNMERNEYENPLYEQSMTMIRSLSS